MFQLLRLNLLHAQLTTILISNEQPAIVAWHNMGTVGCSCTIAGVLASDL